MSANENCDIIICDKKLCLDVILPKEVDDIKEKIEEELGIQCVGGEFIPYDIKTNDFGIYGRRWHIRVVISASREKEFYASLRRFCGKLNLSLNENGRSPFDKNHEEEKSRCPEQLMT